MENGNYGKIIMKKSKTIENKSPREHK